MSDAIQHECGIAAIRLKKPLSWYRETHGSWLYGLQKLFLIMEKQHNRGQDGTGIGCCKLHPQMGSPYLFRERSTKKDALSKVFGKQIKDYQAWLKKAEKRAKEEEGTAITETSVKEANDFAAEILLGHLRYGTSGLFQRQACHPYLRRSNWTTRSLMVAGNFTMANAGELNERLIERGQHPIFDSDTQTVLEEIGYQLDQAHGDSYRRLRAQGDLSNTQIQEHISSELDIGQILRDASNDWDGGYVLSGIIGNGDFFMLRDPHGIRPCHVYENEELIAFASERSPLLTAFACEQEEVSELKPAHALIIKADGTQKLEQIHQPQEEAQCTFERIYFSRGNDPDIYQERKALGAALAQPIMKELEGDFEHSVFSFIPNTAETAYYGLMDGLRSIRREEVRDELLEASKRGELSSELLDRTILSGWPRGEKIAHKDVKLRTFIAQEGGRDQLVSHVYDITYGVVQPEDSLVVLDDSIVRGTTLKKSILRILARTNPKQILIASTAPQIRYPDCYGIDMAEVGKFIAFQAAIRLLDVHGKRALEREVFELAQAELQKPAQEQVNVVKRIYEPFSAEEISAEISRMVFPENSPWSGKVQVIYQSIEDLRACLPQHTGMWYFTGDYPTPTGNKIANVAFVRYFKGLGGRGYELF